MGDEDEGEQEKEKQEEEMQEEIKCGNRDYLSN